MKPITLSKFVVGASVARVASALAAGEITLFEREGFQGRRLTIRGTRWNLDRTDFNDRAESIIVRDGVWEVCSDARFSEPCARLATAVGVSLSMSQALISVGVCVAIGIA